MDALLYDGTFEGFLSTVFYLYEYKLPAPEIYRQQAPPFLFGEVIRVETDEAKADRVWQGLAKKLSPAGLQSLYCSFLADTLREENNMVAFIQYVLASKHNVERDFSNFTVMRLQKTERMVHREKHRMEAFIRFKLTKDHIYYAAISPDFNVIPLIKNHFERRYADQQWIIYDLKRNYGIYYNLQQVETVALTFSDDKSTITGQPVWMHEKEELYQTLWQQYFKSVNIASRKNLKLHIQHMPKRYWKYLSEKQGFGKEMK